MIRFWLLIGFLLACCLAQADIRASASACQRAELSPDSARDGDFSTRWSSPAEDGHWLELDLERRQELKAALHMIAAAGEAERLADLARVPDFSVGVTYTFIGKPPVDQGDGGKDAVGLNLGLTLPLWETKNRARVREAEYRRMAAERDRQCP